MRIQMDATQAFVGVRYTCSTTILKILLITELLFARELMLLLKTMYMRMSNCRFLLTNSMAKAMPAKEEISLQALLAPILLLKPAVISGVPQYCLILIHWTL